MNNLRQISIAAFMWADDNNLQFPWQISTNRGGTMEYTNRVVPHFQILSNELINPRILACLENRYPATSFALVDRTNINYFIGLDATRTNNGAIHVGCSQLMVDGQLTGSGMVSVSSANTLSWAPKPHRRMGVLAFCDGVVSPVKPEELRKAFDKAGLSRQRLVIP